MTNEATATTTILSNYQIDVRVLRVTHWEMRDLINSGDFRLPGINEDVDADENHRQRVYHYIQRWIADRLADRPFPSGRPNLPQWRPLTMKYEEAEELTHLSREKLRVLSRANDFPRYHNGSTRKDSGYDRASVMQWIQDRQDSKPLPNSGTYIPEWAPSPSDPNNPNNPHAGEVFLTSDELIALLQRYKLIPKPTYKGLWRLCDVERSIQYLTEKGG